MTYKILFYLLVLVTTKLLYSCATQTTATGGPKDEKPPELVSSHPQNNSTNFNDQSIVLTFDEWVVLKNPREEIIIIPSIGKEIKYVSKGKKIIITPEELWKDSTTYSMSFRESIRDITEGNVPPNLKLAFSTGSIIDSLQIYGETVDAKSKKALNNITIAIYKQDTFDILNDIPRYWTESNEKGKFSINNLPTGKYWMYAFNDKSKNLKLETKSEQYGFLKDQIDVSTVADSLQINLITLDSRKPKISYVKNLGPITRVKFNKNMKLYKLDSKEKQIHCFGDTQEEVIIWNPINDSTEIKVSGYDSLNYKVDSTFFIKSIETKYASDPFQWKINNATIDSETENLQINCTLNKPIKEINYDSLYIQLDSITRLNFQANEFTIDTINKKLEIVKHLKDTILLSSNAPQLVLLAGKGFLMSMDSDSSSVINSSITRKNYKAPSNIHIEITTEEQNFLIQLLVDKQTNQEPEIIRTVENKKQITFDNLQPGNYRIRAIIDTNKNKVWDWGNIFERVEPEKIYNYKSTEGQEEIPLRENWDVGPLNFNF